MITVGTVGARPAVNSATMRILVLHGSSGNLGDTAMLEGVVLNLLRNLPAAELFVADQPGLRTNLWDLPRVHRQLIPGLVFPYEVALAEVPYLWRYDAKWRRAIRKWLALGLGRIFSANAISVPSLVTANSKHTLYELCAQFDALHMVGGGYLTDTFPDLLVQVSCLAQAFVEQEKPILLTGQQVGPFQSQILQALAARLLRGARFVGLREPTRSVEFCQEFHLDPKRFRVMGDDSLGLPCSGEAEISACLAAHRLEPGKFLAFNVRVGPYAAEHGKYLQFIARLAEGLACTFRLPVLMVPIAFNDIDSDNRSGEELLNLMQHAEVRRIDSAHLTPGLVRGLLGKAFGAIGVSYHFCIFALSQGVPAVSLYEGDYYSQKARGICGLWQDDRLGISLQKADISSAVEHISTLLQDLPLRAKLGQQARFAIEDWRKIFDEQVQKNFGSQYPLRASIGQERPELPARLSP
jgi:polysaccharide pyruvyl transferase WcaK-like protein